MTHDEIMEGMSKINRSIEIVENELKILSYRKSQSKVTPEEILKHIGIIKQFTETVTDGIAEYGSDSCKMEAYEALRDRTSNGFKPYNKNIEIFCYRSRSIRNNIVAIFDFSRRKVKVLKGSEFILREPGAWIEKVADKHKVYDVIHELYRLSELDVCGTCQDDFSVADFERISLLLKQGKTPAVKLDSHFINSGGNEDYVAEGHLDKYQISKLRKDTSWMDMQLFLYVVAYNTGRFYKDWRSVVNGEPLVKRMRENGTLVVKHNRVSNRVFEL